MGRFQFYHQDDVRPDVDDGNSVECDGRVDYGKDRKCDEPLSPMEWEFTASDAQEASALSVLPHPNDDHRHTRRRTTSKRPRLNHDRDNSNTNGVYNFEDHTPVSRPPFIVLVPSSDSSSMMSVHHTFDMHHTSLRQQRRRTWCTTGMWYMLCILVGCLAIWLQREGPPAPPPLAGSNHHRNWNEFLLHHAQHVWQSTSALVVHTPLHVLHWWFHSLRLDLKDVQRRYGGWWSSMQQHKNATHQCTLNVPVHLATSLMEGTSQTTGIVVQPWAVSAVSEAFYAWQHQQHRNPRPLVLFLSGYSSSGKKTLAQSVARLVSNCQGDPKVSSSSSPRLPPLVRVLQGHHYQSRIHVHGEEQSLMHVKLQLEHDILRLGGFPSKPADDGDSTVSFVLIENVEDIDAKVLNWLLAEMSLEHAPRDEDTPTAVRPPSLRDHCCRTVLFLTSSSVGTKTIASWIRQYRPLENTGSNKAPTHRLPPGVVLDMAHEIDDTLGLSVSSKLSAVVPFVPITPDALVELLRQQLAAYASQNPWLGPELVIRDAAAQYLLTRHVEFLSWSRRRSATTTEQDELDTSLESILTFASAGALSIAPVMSTLVAQLARCAAAPNIPPLSDRPGKTAYVDMQRDSTTGILKWCDEYALVATCVAECALDLA